MDQGEAMRVLPERQVDGAGLFARSCQLDRHARRLSTAAYRQALVAPGAAWMRTSGHVYRDGVDYLVDTQLNDGTWFVRTTIGRA